MAGFVAPLRSTIAYVAPSFVAAVVAALAVGMSEAVAAGMGFLAWVGAAGFSLIVLGSAALVLAVLIRIVWGAWRIDELASRYQHPVTEGLGALAGRLAAAALGLWGLAAVVFYSSRYVQSRTAAPVVIMLGTTLMTVAAAAALLAISGPAAERLGRWFNVLDVAVYRRFGSSLFTPRRVIFGVVAVSIGALALSWVLTIRPLIGPFDIRFLWFLLFGLAVTVGCHVLWSRLSFWGTISVGAGALVAAAMVLSGALYARFSRPTLMLAIWGDTQIAGGAVDVLFDIESIRPDLRMDELAPHPRRGRAQRSVVLISVDTVRADVMPFHGGNAMTPALARLAQRGVVFDKAISPGNVTRRSLPSIITGLSPERIRGRVVGWGLRLDPRHVVVAERFRAAGYATAGFFCCDSLFGKSKRLGMNRGLDHVALHYRGADLASAAGRWLAERDPAQPFFVWLHLIEPHRWKEDYPRSKHRLGSADRYALSLNAVDEALAPLLRQLEDKEGGPHIVFTSDHGEALGERGIRNHGTTLYDIETHVPLVIAGPGISPGRVSGPMGLAGLAPTLLELAGFEAPTMPEMDGRSFAELLAGAQRRAEDEVAYSVMMRDRSSEKSGRAVWRGTRKLIVHGDGTKELYDLARDPHELKNILDQDRAAAARMEADLRRQSELSDIPAF